MNPSTKLLLDEMRRLFAEQNAWLDRRFAEQNASIAPTPAPSATAASVTTAPALSATTSVTPAPAPPAAAYITPAPVPSAASRVALRAPPRTPAASAPSGAARRSPSPTTIQELAALEDNNSQVCSAGYKRLDGELLFPAPSSFSDPPLDASGHPGRVQGGHPGLLAALHADPLHMSVGSSSASPVSDVFGNGAAEYNDNAPSSTDDYVPTKCSMYCHSGFTSMLATTISSSTPTWVSAKLDGKLDQMPRRYTTIVHPPHPNGVALFGLVAVVQEAPEVFEEMAKHISEILWPPPMHISNMLCTASIPLAQYLVHKSIQSCFSPSWDAVPHRQPWPPPVQFEIQSDGVQLRPMPWPSFGCLTMRRNTYFLHKCLMWLLCCEISGEYWKLWSSYVYKDEMMWITSTWEGCSAFSFPHITTRYAFAHFHIFPAWVSLLASQKWCDQSKLLVLTMSKLSSSSTLLHNFTAPVIAPAAVQAFRIRCSRLVCIPRKTFLMQLKRGGITQFAYHSLSDGSGISFGKLTVEMGSGSLGLILSIFRELTTILISDGLVIWVCISDLCSSTRGRSILENCY